MAVGDYSAQIQASAQKYGVDPALVTAVMSAESSGDPNATSPTGAQGLMQLEPGTARALGVSNAYDPAQNIDGGTKYLAELLTTFHGDTTLAVAAYNAGPGAVEKYHGVPPYAETQNYVRTVMGKLGSSGSIGSAVSYVVGDTLPVGTGPGTTIATTPGRSSYGPAQSANGPAAQQQQSSASGGSWLDTIVAAAQNIATEAFLGALALALISGGILWLATIDGNVSRAVSFARKASA